MVLKARYFVTYPYRLAHFLLVLYFLWVRLCTRYESRPRISSGRMRTRMPSPVKYGGLPGSALYAKGTVLLMTILLTVRSLVVISQITSKIKALHFLLYHLWIGYKKRTGSKFNSIVSTRCSNSFFVAPDVCKIDSMPHYTDAFRVNVSIKFCAFLSAIFINPCS